MLKKELIAALYGRTHMTRQQLDDCLDALAYIVKEGLKYGGVITLPGIGTLSVVQRAARTGRNPATGQPIAIAAHKTVKLKACNALRDAIN